MTRRLFLFCRKRYGSANAYLAHIQSKKHKDLLVDATQDIIEKQEKITEEIRKGTYVSPQPQVKETSKPTETAENKASTSRNT